MKSVPKDHGKISQEAGPAGPPSSPADSIGQSVIAYRKAKGLGVSELARMVGVSPSLISQIERGQSRPSVATLFSLAKALETPIDDFFTDDSAADHQSDAGEMTEQPASPGVVGSRSWHVSGSTAHRYLIRKDERPSLEVQGGIRWERLTPTSLDPLDFLELIYMPGAESNPVPYTHAGLEMVLVLEGELQIQVGFDLYKLYPGDSITFPSSMPHKYVNPSQGTSRAISVIVRDEISPPSQSQ